jgi:hypothetical protein
MLSNDNNERARDICGVAAARHEGVFLCLGFASGGSPPMNSVRMTRASSSPGPSLN